MMILSSRGGAGAARRWGGGPWSGWNSGVGPFGGGGGGFGGGFGGFGGGGGGGGGGGFGGFGGGRSGGGGRQRRLVDMNHKSQILGTQSLNPEHESLNA